MKALSKYHQFHEVKHITAIRIECIHVKLDLHTYSFMHKHL